MQSALTILRRTLLAPGAVPVAGVALGLSWLGTRVLAGAVLGADEGFTEQVRQGSLLFAGVLMLSLAEPTQLGADARAGLLSLRLVRGRGTGLLMRCLALVGATLPVLVLCALASGGWPSHPGRLLLQLLVVAAGGLFLGAWLERRLMVPALWCLVLGAHLVPWLEGPGRVLAWVLPRLDGLERPGDVAHALFWVGGALLLADRRALDLAARGG